jgi:hypothetical protein
LDRAASAAGAIRALNQLLAQLYRLGARIE